MARRTPGLLAGVTNLGGHQILQDMFEVECLFSTGKIAVLRQFFAGFNDIKVFEG